MNPRARRILRRTFIAAFFVIAPVIILSTAGYRYNFSRQRFERTGVMLVETHPEDATVSLGGKVQKSLTPARLQKLSPGPYAVRIEKAGYRAWEKTVAVRSRETAFLNEISLFRDAAPALHADVGTTTVAAFSRDGRYAAAVTATRSGAELVVVDLRDGSETRPYRAAAAPADLALAWSRDGRRLIVRRGGATPEHLLWDAADPERMRDLSDVSGLAVEHALWAQDADRLYVAARGILYEIDVPYAMAIPAGPALDAMVVAGDAAYGIRAGAPPTLVKHRLREDALETVAELPSAAFAPIAGRDGKIAYASASGERLFVIDPASGRSEAFEGRGRGGSWSADGERFLYWNDLELRIYDARDGSDALITRLSRPILQAAWHRPEWNALYAAGGDLFAVETSDRSGRVTVPLASFEDLRAFAVGRNGAGAYAFGAYGGREGLWKLRLR